MHEFHATIPVTRFDDNARPVSTLGRYRLLGEIAQGGMGIVYLAMVSGLGGFHKLFAVKELKRELALEEDAVTPFLREARLAARLSHPNVVQTFEVGSQNGRHYMAMEYLEGESLARILSRARAMGQPLPLALGLTILTSLLDGLHYAHTLADFTGQHSGVVHRDVSPQNVLVTFDGQTKVLDFGIAKALDSVQLTQVGSPKGKVRYMSPEQALGELVDPRADVFSVGVMLAELISGGRLWPVGQTNLEVLRDLVAGRIPSIDAIAPDADAALRSIASKAIAIKREDRYESALAMREELEAYLRSVPDQARDGRAIGAYVSQLLAEERQERRATIAERLCGGQGEATNAELLVARMVAEPSIATNEREATTTRACAPSAQDSTRRDLPSTDAARADFQVVNMVALPLVASHDSEATMTRVYVTSGRDAARQALAARTPRRPWARTAALTLGALVVSSVVALRPASSPAPGSAPMAEPSSLGSAAPVVGVSIAAEPTSARVYLDGQRLANNPEVVRVPRSTQPLVLRVEAEGFETQELSVVPDRERSLVLALRAAPPPPSPPAASGSGSMAARKAERPVSAPPRVFGPRRRDLEPF